VSGFLLRRGLPAAASRKAVMVCSAILMLAGLPAVRPQTRFGAIAWISVVLFAYSSWAANILSLPADLFTPPGSRPGYGAERDRGCDRRNVVYPAHRLACPEPLVYARICGSVRDDRMCCDGGGCLDTRETSGGGLARRGVRRSSGTLAVTIPVNI
jgi:hypothetical protein